MQMSIVTSWFALRKAFMDPDRVTQCMLPGRCMHAFVYVCSLLGPHTLTQQNIQTFYVLHVALP